MTDFSLLPLLPEIFMALIAMGLLIAGVSTKNESTPVICWASAIGLMMAALVLLGMDWSPNVVLNGMFKMDQFAGMAKLMILLGLLASIVLSVRYLEQERMGRFEYPVIVLIAGIGMMLMVSANNLLSLYMALELQSLSLYVLAAFNRNSTKSAEAGVKYFVLGALSSGMLLFGMSLVYGFTGSLDFNTIHDTLLTIETIPAGFTIGMVFILAGLAFKISAVPFHMWTPDVYQGAPLCVTALFAIVPKTAAMALLIRLLLEAFGPAQDQWMQIIYFISVASMIVGAFAAIAQEEIRRLIAYSSIGNMGYALVGVIAATPQGIGAVLLYLFIYMVMTSGVFVVLAVMRREDKSLHKISDLAGLSRTSPALAYAMAVFMFSMSGIPPLAGFFSKLFIFQAAIAQGYIILAVLGVLTSVVAAYYYLRIVKVMFFDEPADKFNGGMSFSQRALLLITVVFVLGFILRPGLLVASTQNAAMALFGAEKLSENMPPVPLHLKAPESLDENSVEN